MCDTNINQHHETRKQQVAKYRRPGTHRAASNPPNQGNERKYGGNKHHQDQDAPRPGVIYIRYLQIEFPDVRKCQTRRVPRDDKGL